MNPRQLFLKYLTIKTRLLARPDAMIVSAGSLKNRSAYNKSLIRIKSVASYLLDNELIQKDQHEVSLLKQIIGE